jgi:F-type H+-transporting ATPase subunit gamma
VRFISGEVGRVFLAYNHFNSAINQEPRVVPLLPIEPPAQTEDEAGARDTRETLFEPSRAAVLDVLLPNYLENQCFLAHLNTEAGEHGARMVAMDGATNNAREMIKRLTLQMNKARQAAITKELIEIVNGAQAL